MSRPDDEKVLRRLKAADDGALLENLIRNHLHLLNDDGEPDDAKILDFLKSHPPGEKRKLYQIVLEEYEEPPEPLTPEEQKVLAKAIKAGWGTPLWRLTKEQIEKWKAEPNPAQRYTDSRTWGWPDAKERRELIDQLKAKPEAYQLFLRSTRLPVPCPQCGEPIHPAKRSHDCGWRK